MSLVLLYQMFNSKLMKPYGVLCRYGISHDHHDYGNVVPVLFKLFEEAYCQHAIRDKKTELKSV